MHSCRDLVPPVCPSWRQKLSWDLPRSPGPAGHSRLVWGAGGPLPGGLRPALWSPGPFVRDETRALLAWHRSFGLSRHSDGSETRQELRTASNGTGVTRGCCLHQGQPWGLRWAPLPISAGLYHTSAVTGPSRGRGTRRRGPGPRAPLSAPGSPRGNGCTQQRPSCDLEDTGITQGERSWDPTEGRGSEQDTIAWQRIRMVPVKAYLKPTAHLAAPICGGRRTWSGGVTEAELCLHLPDEVQGGSPTPMACRGPTWPAVSRRPVRHAGPRSRPPAACSLRSDGGQIPLSVTYLVKDEGLSCVAE